MDSESVGLAIILGMSLVYASPVPEKPAVMSVDYPSKFLAELHVSADGVIRKMRLPPAMAWWGKQNFFLSKGRTGGAEINVSVQRFPSPMGTSSCVFCWLV